MLIRTGKVDEGLTDFLALVNAPKPPQRLAPGSDTVARIEAKNRLVEAELTEWKALALSTDFKV